MALQLATHPSQPARSGRLPYSLGTRPGQASRELTAWALLELPEKQEQLAAIYAVLEHLPEANHNSLERLIFHLVKQVPAACCLRGGGPHPEPRRGVPGAGVLWWFCPKTWAYVRGSGRLFYGDASPPLPTSRVRRPRSRGNPRAPASGLGASLATPNCRSPRRVALLEDVNRMSPSALAIIFAPCLLRCPDNSDPLTSMKDVLKVTT